MFSSKFQTLVAKKALIGNNSKRLFSSINQGPKMGFGNSLAIGMGGIGIMGLTYLSYMGHQMRAKATPQQ